MNSMFGLHVTDIIMPALYFLGMAAIVFGTAGKINQCLDFGVRLRI